METHYLIDYENTGARAFQGSQKLSKQDHIHLFYTENSKNITVNILSEHGSAKIDTYKIPNGKQSLDMHLVSYLGFLIGTDPERKNRYVILSYDSDYDKIIQFWKAKNITISRCQNFSGSTSPAVSTSTLASSKKKVQVKTIQNKSALNTEIHAVLKQAGYSGQILNQSAQIACQHYKDPNYLSQIHAKLVALYTQDKAAPIYKLIKPILKKYHDQKPEKVTTIQTTLQNAGIPAKEITSILEIVKQNKDKSRIHTALVKQYGSDKGLKLYREIRELL
ncbi:MAG: hypothetical protein K2J71_08165 [Oscillospiraceae bacterium]|nr:hypothetical protein [Oscillospiraceae bacterium]